MWAGIGASIVALVVLLARGWSGDAWTIAAGVLLVTCVGICALSAVVGELSAREVDEAVGWLVEARRSAAREHRPSVAVARHRLAGDLVGGAGVVLEGPGQRADLPAGGGDGLAGVGGFEPGQVVEAVPDQRGHPAQHPAPLGRGVRAIERHRPDQARAVMEEHVAATASFLVGLVGTAAPVALVQS